MNEQSTEKTIYQKWLSGEVTNLGGFATSLMETYLRADCINSEKLIKAFPEYFVRKTKKTI